MLSWRERQKIIAEEELRRSIRRGGKVGFEKISAVAAFAAAVAAISSAISAFRLERITVEAAVRQERAAFESNLYSKQVDLISSIEKSINKVSHDLVLMLINVRHPLSDRKYKALYDGIEGELHNVSQNVSAAKSVFGVDVYHQFLFIGTAYSAVLQKLNKALVNQDYHVRIDAGEAKLLDEEVHNIDMKAWSIVSCISEISSVGLISDANKISKCKEGENV